METLELKYLKYYLDTRAKVEWKRDDGALIINDLTISDYNFLIIEKKAKLICHPLSDLTKPIEHKGEKFVPDQILQKYVNANDGLLRYKKQDIYDLASCEYWVIEKLFEWHFWIFDQSYFNKDILIDINTLKK